ncbi:MAG TPA: DUF892 family protein [Opitutales bacterium]|nr:DUF892 family protein [Opitutales bacterium]
MSFSENFPDYFGDDAAPRWEAAGNAPLTALPGLAEAPSEPTAEGSFEKHWLRTLAHVLTEEVQELYSAEKLLGEVLPMMALASADPVLRATCEVHLEHTSEHLRRLECVQEILGLAADGRNCLTMEGLLIGLRETIEENRPGPSRDRALVEAARKIKHFEVAGYCGARDFAQLLGLAPVVEILQKTLDEESTLEAKFANLEELMVLRG